MTAPDLPAALSLWAAASGVELDRGDEPAELARYLERNPGLSHVALGGDELVAAVLAGHDGRRGFLYHLAVREDHRGRGCGRELVAAATDALRRAGIPRALILVVSENHTGARFWQRQGWEPLTTAHAMALDL